MFEGLWSESLAVFTWNIFRDILRFLLVSYLLRNDYINESRNESGNALDEIQKSKREEGVEGGLIAQLNYLISSLTRFLIEFNCGMLRSHLRIISHLVLNLFLMLSVFTF